MLIKVLQLTLMTTLLVVGAAGLTRGVPTVTAAEASTEFDRANRLYEAGKYKEAIGAYQQMVARREISAPLYFNLGNAYFRNSQPGEAIYYYRLAQRLAPRDPDIRANLRFARERIATGAPPQSRWERGLTLLTLNELTAVCAGLLWVCFMLLVAGQIRPDWRRSLRGYVGLSGLAALLSIAWLVVVLQYSIWTPPAVVVVPDAPLRYGPFEEAKSFSTLHAGAEVTVLSRKEKWLQVRDHGHRVGWLQQQDLRVVPYG